MRGRPKNETRPCLICGSRHPFYKVGSAFYCQDHKREAFAAARAKGGYVMPDTRWLNEHSGGQFSPTVPHIT